MDPHAVWDTVLDESIPPSERAEAGLALLVWLAKGGSLPSNADRPGEGIWQMTARVITTCESAVASQLDRGDL